MTKPELDDRPENEAPDERGMGHNLPPLWDVDKLAKLTARSEKLTDDIEAWVKREIEDDEAAEDLRDVLGMVVALKKDAEAQRSADKKQHLDAGKAVDEAFHAIGRRLDRLTGPPKDKLDAWLEIKEAERLAAEVAARQKAEDARAESARLEALALETGSIRAEEAAEDAASAAKKADKTATRIEKTVVRVASASGGTRAASARKRPTAILEDLNLAFLHFRKHPALAELLTRLANAELWAKDGPADVPGFNTKMVRTIV
jgi:hypothetical protein